MFLQVGSGWSFAVPVTPPSGCAVRDVRVGVALTWPHTLTATQSPPRMGLRMGLRMEEINIGKHLRYMYVCVHTFHHV